MYIQSTTKENNSARQTRTQHLNSNSQPLTPKKIVKQYPFTLSTNIQDQSHECYTNWKSSTSEEDVVYSSSWLMDMNTTTNQGGGGSVIN